MSMHPYISMGYGYELDVTNSELVSRLMDLFPKEAEECRDDDGELTDFITFMYEISESFRGKYPDLSLIVAVDDYAQTFLAIDRKSGKDLYDKYGDNDSGVIRPQNLYYDTTEGLAQFAKDLGLKTEPEILIWTYWG